MNSQALPTGSEGSRESKGKIAVVLGTRPEIIKLAEIVTLLGDRALLIHTGQHWDHAMSGSFMAELGLPTPTASLAVGGGSRANQIAGTILGVDQVLSDHDVAAVVVQGDTNTVLGGAIAANSNNVPLIHVEAGLRSFDRRMPEEHNRVATDHLADLCLAPTEHSRELLLREGIPDDRIVVTGNTVVAAAQRALNHGSGAALSRLESLGLAVGEYALATIHRPENTDGPQELSTALTLLGEISRTVCPILIPLHPRARQRAEAFGLQALLNDLVVVEPLAYDEFVNLSANAAFTISDSGGVQEEASVWKRPVVVLRRSTERPEVIGTFAQLAKPDHTLVETAAALFSRRVEMAERLRKTPSPYGDGSAARLSVDAIFRFLNVVDGQQQRA